MSNHARQSMGQSEPAVSGGCLSFGAFLIVTLVGSPLGAQEVRSPTQATRPPSATAQPPRISRASLELGEAVMLTMLHDPQISLAKQDIALAVGQLQEAQGVFDQILQATPAYSYDRHENFPALVNQEKKKRQQLTALATAYAALNRSLQDALAQNQLTFPTCPEGVEFEEVNILEGRDIVRSAGISFEDAFIVRLGGLEQEAADIFKICIPANDTGPRPDSVLKILDRINQTSGLGLNDLIVNLTQYQTDRLALAQNIAEAVATKAQLSLDRLGVVPVDEAVKTTSIDVGYLKPFRTGIQMSADFRLQSSGRNFIDKTLDPSFGGSGVRNQFPSLASVSLDVPLGKGRGRVSVAAPERAAERNVEAQRQRLRHTMSNEAFGTVVAYLDLLGAQETLVLLEESAGRQQRLVDLTQQLIDADEVPRTDLDRARARAAIVNGAVADGRLTVLIGRFVLANAIGLEVTDLANAPLAADAFPGTLAPVPDIDQLLGQAMSQRRDRKALEDLRDATRFLAEAAKADLKRTLDFFVTAGLSTLYESPFFKYLPDELDEIPADTSVHYYSPRGYFRSLSEDWKPFFKVGLSVDFPFRNNVAEGRLLQQESSLTTSEIQLVDLQRVIQDNIVQVKGALERARESIERHRASIGYYEQTLQSAIERFRAGDITLVDMLTTEEDLTQQKLQLVQAVQVYLSLLARLRFEVGSLINFEGEGTELESVRFDPLSFVTRRSG